MLAHSENSKGSAYFCTAAPKLLRYWLRYSNKTIGIVGTFLECFWNDR